MNSPAASSASATAERIERPAPGCPLCGGRQAKPSWLGSTVYDGQTYSYLQCEGCRSLYCDPMPRREALARLYGSEYQVVLADHGDGGEREIGRVIRSLQAGRRIPGTFVDYGCGRGRLMREVSRLGWRAIGVEFDDAVAASVAREIGLSVVGRDEAHRSLGGGADVLHLGDVIEHLTAIDKEMPAILELIAPGGVLIAQGPLESNANLFTLVLRVSRTMTQSGESAMPPYHVSLATADGQRRLFTRLGLVARDFEISEVAWPAPQRLGLRDIGNPRKVGLWVLRLVSQIISHIGPRDWGNRYFYVGQRTRLSSQLEGSLSAT